MKRQKAENGLREREKKKRSLFLTFLLISSSSKVCSFCVGQLELFVFRGFALVAVSVEETCGRSCRCNIECESSVFRRLPRPSLHG